MDNIINDGKSGFASIINDLSYDLSLDNLEKLKLKKNSLFYRFRLLIELSVIISIAGGIILLVNKLSNQPPSVGVLSAFMFLLGYAYWKLMFNY